MAKQGKRCACPLFFSSSFQVVVAAARQDRARPSGDSRRLFPFASLFVRNIFLGGPCAEKNVKKREKETQEAKGTRRGRQSAMAAPLQGRRRRGVVARRRRDKGKCRACRRSLFAVASLQGGGILSWRGRGLASSATARRCSWLLSLLAVLLWLGRHNLHKQRYTASAGRVRRPRATRRWWSLLLLLGDALALLCTRHLSTWRLLLLLLPPGKDMPWRRWRSLLGWIVWAAPRWPTMMRRITAC